MSKVKCSCIQCKKEFSINGIHVHVQRTHENKSFTKIDHQICNICDKKFNSKQGLIGHQYRSHFLRENQKIYGKKGNESQIGKPGSFAGRTHSEKPKSIYLN